MFCRTDDPPRDYDRWCDEKARAAREALEDGRIFRCGCGDYHEREHKTVRYRRSYRGRTEKRVLVQPRELDGTEYGAACFLRALVQRREQ